MPEILYHYTDQSGLLGILRSKSLWATRIHYLNDTKEYWHAIDVAKLELNRMMNESGFKERKQELVLLLDELKSLLAVGTVVCSFSERGDALSQWRSYVGRQPGFSLGFDVEGLRALTKDTRFAIQPCYYKKEDQQKLVLSVIEKILENEIKESRIETYPPNSRLHFSVVDSGVNRELENIAPFIKHEAFEDEREWRLISDGHHGLEIKHRPGISMLTPYVEFGLTVDGTISILREIIIGPTPHEELAIYSVQQLLSRCDWINPKPVIINSNAPYRYW